jgi:putative heme iron utilization protein
LSASEKGVRARAGDDIGSRAGAARREVMTVCVSEESIAFQSRLLVERERDSSVRQTDPRAVARRRWASRRSSAPHSASRGASSASRCAS